MELTSRYYPQGPWPVKDEVGFQVALEIVDFSLKPGKTSKTRIQFDSVRPIRTMHQHMFESGPGKFTLVLKTMGENGQPVVMHTSNCPTSFTHIY